uniref:Uncharacterized protein n=1 Tax=Acrobeloides nanus TaxID=290746 RepID=A0A914D315_9BILA
MVNGMLPHASDNDTKNKISGILATLPIDSENVSSKESFATIKPYTSWFHRMTFLISGELTKSSFLGFRNLPKSIYRLCIPLLSSKRAFLK